MAVRTRAGVSAQRLHNQRVEWAGPRSPARTVEWLGAVQAQEYGPARWGLGLRMPEGVTDANIAHAFDAGRVLRRHVLRPTWHFVTPADIRWMLELTAPRIQRSMRPYNGLHVVVGPPRQRHQARAQNHRATQHEVDA